MEKGSPNGKRIRLITCFRHWIRLMFSLLGECSMEQLLLNGFPFYLVQENFQRRIFLFSFIGEAKKCNRRVVRSVYFCWADYKRDSILYLNVSLFLLLTIGESSIIVFEWCIYLKFVDGILGGISGLERDRTIGNQC